MIVTLSLAMILMAGHAIGDPPKGVAPVREVVDAIDCGPRSLYLLLQLEGRPTELDRIVALLPRSEGRGASLLEIRDAARSCGLTLTGVQLGSKALNLDRPAIVHLNRAPHDHFVVVRPFGHTGKLVQVLDPNRRPEVMDKDQFLASPEWSGAALIPTRPNYRLAGMLSLGMVVVASLWGRKTLRRRRHTNRRVVGKSAAEVPTLP